MHEELAPFQVAVGRRSAYCPLMRTLFLTVILCLISAVSLAETTPANSKDAPLPGGTINGGTGEKSYTLPAFEIVGFQLLLNQLDRHITSDPEDYETGPGTIHRNLSRRWKFDEDPFAVNQFGHPFQGSIYYGLARSQGLNFWESSLYTAGGSTLWEIAGETTRPSINDEITTSIAGSFLGEVFFRMADALWPNGDEPLNWGYAAGATALSPGYAFNRAVFNGRYTPPSNNQRPSTFAKFGVGVLHNGKLSGATEAEHSDPTLASLSFDMVYGSPGKSGYHYDRPFDYFTFAGTLDTSRNDPLENLFVRGLLYGTDYDVGSSSRGIYGLYGSYDYFAPELFRVSTTALSLGTTNEWRISPLVSLQGNILGGAGFGTGGSIAATQGGRDYHYGTVPQGFAGLRLLLAQRFSVNASARGYYVAGPGSDDGDARERITRTSIGATMRLRGPHSISVDFISSKRDASFESHNDRHQSVNSLGVYYTYLLGQGMGETSW